ncbi:DUF4123 domain-containing protein [Vibrio rumoiensis]|uniref:DUF4123 domain-containing protein n=1 Tax=Vibrio rumoiensis TaxID=76258 RepID=UPI000B5C8D3F|nr:DUF4123 domain-containing protein [Vibrio rumoiensis]
MLASWFFKQKQAYWLASADVHQQAIKENHQLGFNDVIPLFHGEQFKEVMPFSPWLIPAQESLNHVAQETFDNGIVFVSDSDIWDVIKHLRSMLYAALDGEEVLFRFYDPNVLAPMFATFTQDEINAFLGNGQHIAIMQEQELKIYRNHSQLPFQLIKATWWKIKPHHLEPLYKVEAHARAIERRLWERMPEQINQFESPSLTLQKILQQAIDNGASVDKAEQAVLVAFAQQTGVDYWELSQALFLDDNDVQLLKEIEKEMALWEC